MADSLPSSGAAATGGTPPATPLGGRPMSMTALRSIVIRFGWIGLNTVTGILAARALHPQGRGELAAITLWPMLVGGVTTFGLPTALLYYVRREPERASAFAGSALVLVTAITGLGMAIAWFLIPLWLRQQPPHIVAAAQLCVLAAPTASLATLGRMAWEARGRFGRSNISQLIPPMLVIVGLGTLAWLGLMTPVSAAAVYILAGVPAFAWVVWSVVRLYRPTLRGIGGASRQLLHYGARSYGVDLAGILSVYLDQALAVGLLTPAAMGIYAVALNVARVVASANGSVAMVMFPRLVNLEPDEMARAVARAGRMASIAGIGIGLAVLAVGPLLLRLLYGPAFGAAIEILPILVCQVIVAGLVYVLLQGFLAAGRPGVATTVQLTGTVLSVPLFLLLVPRFGLVGAALGLLISATARLVLTIVCYRAILRVPTPRVWFDTADFADLARYRTTLVSSMLRFLPAGGTK